MKLENYLHLYLGCEILNKPYRHEKELEEEYRDKELIGTLEGISKDTAYVLNKDVCGDTWPKYSESLISCVKPILRPLESLTDEETQECLVDVFLVSPHIAYMDVEALQQYLCNNTEYTLGCPEEESLPMMEFAVTPQTYFNLTHWLIKRGFDLFGLIAAGSAVEQSN